MGTSTIFIILVFGVIPLVSIVGGIYSKNQRDKMKFQQHGLDSNEKQLLKKLIKQNRALKGNIDSLQGRIENLEAIITDADMNMLNEMQDEDFADENLKTLDDPFTEKDIEF